MNPVATFSISKSSRPVTANPSVPACSPSDPPVMWNGPGRLRSPPMMVASIPIPVPSSTRSTSTRSSSLADGKIFPRPTKPSNGSKASSANSIGLRPSISALISAFVSDAAYGKPGRPFRSTLKGFLRISFPSSKAVPFIHPAFPVPPLSLIFSKFTSVTSNTRVFPICFFQGFSPFGFFPSESYGRLRTRPPPAELKICRLSSRPPSALICCAESFCRPLACA